METDVDDLRVLQRQFVWDMINHQQVVDPDMQKYFGLQPASTEVLEMEHTASHQRMGAILPVYGRVRALCAVATGVANRAILSYYGDGEDDGMYTQAIDLVASALTLAVIADLIDKRMLIVPEGLRV